MLDELCRAGEFWDGCHAALVSASHSTREKICRVLLDSMRRELAIDAEYLKTDFYEQLQLQSSQRLRPPWSIDEQERQEFVSAVFPRSRRLTSQS